MSTKINKKRHLAVVGIIFDKRGRILLSQRHEPKSTYAHLKWQFPGGSINFGENPLDTLDREVKEEVGIKIKPLTKRPFIHSHVFKRENIHAIVMGFPSYYKAGKLTTDKDKNTKDAKWFLLEELEKLDLLPEVKNMTKEAVKFLIQNSKLC